MKAGWKSATIGATCDLSTGGTPSKARREFFDGGSIRWLVSGDVHQKEIFDCEGRITELGYENSNARFLPINSVIIALNGQGKTRGTVALLRTKATCNQSLVAISPRDADALDPKYLFYNLHSRYDEIRRMTGDGGDERRGLNMPLIRSIGFPLPSLHEQKRIVAVLDEAFEGLARARANAEANLADARELLESHLEREFANPPPDWRLSSLGSLCRKITVGHVGPMAERYTESGIPFLRSQNIRPFQIDLSGVKFIDAEFMAELVKSELRPGDVAIVRTGYPGTCAVIPETLEIANCADLVIARTGPALDPHFMAMLLNSRYGKEHVARVSVGAAQKHFNVAAAKAAQFPVPPLSIQRDLVERAAQVRSLMKELEGTNAAKQDSLDVLRQSLLQKAFAGELT